MAVHYAERGYMYSRCHTFLFFSVTYWLVGLFLGMLLARLLYPISSSLMRMAVIQPVSIVGLLISVVFPIFLSSISVIQESILITVIYFLKVIAYGFCIVSISLAFRTSGWLVCRLFLFSDTLCLVLMTFLRICNNRALFANSVRYIAPVCAVLICVIDFFYISPFLLQIFD